MLNTQEVYRLLYVKHMAGRRVFVGVRVGSWALGVVDRLAKEVGTTRSQMLRTLLGEALTARGLMPDGAAVVAPVRVAAALAPTKPAPAADLAEQRRQENIERMRRNQGRDI